MNLERIELHRADLYAQVWAEPMRRLAKRYSISDVGLSKVCRKLNVPVPPVGYWARKQHGYKVEQPPLSPLSQGMRDVVVIERRPGRPKPPPDVEALIASEPEDQYPIRVPDRVTRRHPLVRQTVSAFQGAKLDEYGMLTCLGQERRLAMRIGRASLSRALRIMDALLKGLELRGFRVGILEGNERATYVDVLGERVRFWLEETTSRHEHVLTKQEQDARARNQWTLIPKWDYTPTGELRLKIAEYTRGGERKTWADGKRHRLEDLLTDVAAGVVLVAHALRTERAERERQAEEWRQAEQRRIELERQRQEEEKHRQQLEQEAAQWMKSQQLRAYIDAVERVATSAGSRVSPEELRQWLEWAREVADHGDPLKALTRLAGECT